MTQPTDKPGHDVFVSYAHADDRPPLNASQGWVTTLVEELRKVLDTKLPRDSDIYQDHRLAANENTPDTLLTALRSSRVLLLNMSPRYQASVWCQRELVRFLEAMDGSSSNRVFVIESERIDRQTWHTALRNLTAMRFWVEGDVGKPHCRLGFPLPTLEDRAYFHRLNELAHFVATELDRAPGGEDEVKPAVWLAEATEDLLEERELLASALRQAGCDVLPRGGYPREGEQVYLDSLRRDLQEAVLAIQLLGPREGGKPGWGEQSFVALQAAESRAAADRRNIRLLRWRARETEPAKATTERYRALLADGVQASGFEEFRQAALTVPAPPKATSVARAKGKPVAWVGADAADLSLAEEVSEVLDAQGVEPLLATSPDPGRTPEQIRLAHQVELQRCYGAVILHQRAPRSWVNSQVILSGRVLAQRVHGDWGLLIDWASEAKAAIASRGLRRVECRERLDPTLLAPFVATLKERACV